jgi:hypothetical protein
MADGSADTDSGMGGGSFEEADIWQGRSLDVSALSSKLPQLKEWDPATIKPEYDKGGFRMAIFGRSGNGKTHATEHILKRLTQKMKFEEIRLVSPTSAKSSDFDCIDKKDIIEGYDEIAIQQFVDKFAQKNENVKERGRKARGLIIFDDVISEPSFANSPILKYLSVRGRHDGLSYIILSQLIAKSVANQYIRANLHVVVSSAVPSREDQKTVCDLWLGFLPRKMALAALNRYTADPFAHVVFDLTKPGQPTLKETCYRYKAPAKKMTSKLKKSRGRGRGEVEDPEAVVEMTERGMRRMREQMEARRQRELEVSEGDVFVFRDGARIVPTTKMRRPRDVKRLRLVYSAPVLPS